MNRLQPVRSLAPEQVKPAPSQVISNLANLSHRMKDPSPMNHITRSSNFSERPAPQIDADMDIPMNEAVDAPKRDDRLALIEDLEVGPTDHKPPFDDPHFQHLEPNSGIRLS